MALFFDVKKLYNINDPEEMCLQVNNLINQLI